MALFKKIIILNGLDNKACAGIIKINTKSGYASAEVQLNNSKELLLLLSTADGVAAFEVEGECTLNLSSIQIKDDIECLVLDNMKPIMFGSTVRDKLKCLNLKEEYIRQNSAVYHTKKESSKNEKSQEPPDKTAESEVTAEEALREPQVTQGNFIKKDTEKSPKIIDKEIREDVISQENNQQTAFFEVEQKDTIKKEKEKPKVESTRAKKCSVESVSKSDENVVSSILSESVPYEGNNFYLAVKPQLDEMFICYPPDIELQNIVPNSKWIRVALPDDYYVVGIVFNIDEPHYICYGLHGNFYQKPPSEIADICQWLPLSREDEKGEGYWVIFQDAKTGLAEKFSDKTDKN